MKKKLLSMIICGVLSCSAFAGASSRPADVDPVPSRVCLITIGEAIYNGNVFTDLRHYDKGESIHTMVHIGNQYAIVVNPNMQDAKRWETSFLTLLRNRCGAI